jgi:putative ABC transport system permease protein
VLIFAGAVVAAFNLTSRIMDAQRREIGIAMALGMPPMRIAIRPLLMGIEIATLGVIVGAIVGYLLGAVMMILVRELMPLPEWQTPFQWRIFAGAAFIGFLLPVVATAWPVWRSVSVAPVNAMRPSYRLSQGGGPARLVHLLRLPGHTFMQIPERNLVRSPRRTLLTVLGISASLAVLVAFIGMIDSFLVTTEQGDQEILGNTPDRLEVMLDSFYPPESATVKDLTGSPLFASSEVGARLGGALLNGDEEIDIQLDLLNITSDMWQPTITKGARDRTIPGLYISEAAAEDLNVDVGDTVTMRHPRVDAFGQVTLEETELPVLGTHPHPFRFVT